MAMKNLFEILNLHVYIRQTFLVCGGELRDEHQGGAGGCLPLAPALQLRHVALPQPPGRVHVQGSPR